MIRIFAILILSLSLNACSSDSVEKIEKPESSEPAISDFAAFFYPIFDKPTVYMFRDSLDGINEVYHRFYTKNIMGYNHTVLEIYQTGGRLTEAYTYKRNDSLSLMAHMVVDRNQKMEMAEVLRTTAFPISKNDVSYFVSRCKGPADSTMILAEVMRAYWKGPEKLTILEKQIDCVIMNDTIRQTIFNPFTKKERAIGGVVRTIYAKNMGVVGYYTDDKRVNVKLERIVSDDEWKKLMMR